MKYLNNPYWWLFILLAVVLGMWLYSIQAVHDAKVRASEECQEQVMRIMEGAINEHFEKQEILNEKDNTKPVHRNRT